MDPLGSGSDYTAFVDHLGVPAMDVGFSGRYGVYHSIYDNFTWMERHGDPEFLTHATAARLYTLIAMRAAGAEVVPLTLRPLRRGDPRPPRRPAADPRAQGTRGGAGRASPRWRSTGSPACSTPSAPSRPRPRRSIARPGALAGRDGVPATRLATVNDALMRVERAFLLPGGPPRPPLVQARHLRPRPDHRLRLLAPPRALSGDPGQRPRHARHPDRGPGRRGSTPPAALRAAKEAASDDGEDRPQ